MSNADEFDGDDYNDQLPEKPTMRQILDSETDQYFILERRKHGSNAWQAFAKTLSGFATLNAYLQLNTDPDFEYRIKRYPGVPLNAWRNYPAFFAPLSIPSREELDYLSKLDGEVCGNVEVNLNDTLKQMGLMKRFGVFCVAVKNMFLQLVLKKGAQ